ncbi:MAG TPA: Crp/Fnr family transcriptional regulator [Fibrobacter sp.]|nr:Crp/Fnr family transcriptional regulator [Fibrobacter sp.]
MELFNENKEFLESHFSFWSHLLPTEQKLVLEKTQTLKCPKGTAVHTANNDCLGVLLIKSGELRVYMVSEEGREITLYRLFEGDVCVLSASCVLSSITFDVFIDAETDSVLLQIPSKVFSDLSEKNIHVESFGHQVSAQRFSDVMWAMQQILFMSFDQRLAIFLIDESVKTGSDTLTFTHEQVAKYTGSAREVVTRMLKYFVQEKTVQLSRGTIQILDKKKLRSMTERK